jgi:hypothetical protein
MRSGRKSAAQTPAPKKDRIYGSKTNPKGSASSEKSAKSIVLSDKTMKSLQGKLKEFKEKHPAKKNITLNDLKAVYRRGLGAYSSSHRPTITGGVPNTRNAWAMARVNKFLLKAGGTKVKAAYVQDDDLMARGGTIDKGAANYGMPNVDWSEMPLIHETKKEIANKIKKDGFVVTTKNNTKGVYTIPTVLKKEKFNPNDVELIVWLKPDSKILWTNTENPSDFYVGYGNKFYQKIYKELNPNWERTLKNQSAFIGSDEQGKFCRKLEDWLSNNGYCGVQQGGEVVITDLDCIDYVEDRSEEFADGGTINYPFTVLIKNIKNPNDSYKSVKNMYRGAYQKIFDILDDDSIFKQWETEEEKLEGNDLYLYFSKKPDSDKVEKISKIPNVQVINIRFAEGGELDNYSVAIKENGLQQPFEWNAYNSEETIYVPENEIYAFLYNAPNTQDKIDDDALIFSNNRGLGNFWEDLKTQKGSESLVAILKGRLSEDKTKLYILTMTTKNEFRKKGLMSKLIREVRSKYNIDKENVIFIGLTDMGQKMYNKKRYADGGNLELDKDYLKITKTKEYTDGFNGIYISADFGRNGGITWEIPLSQIEEGNKYNPKYLIVQSIDRNKDSSEYQGKEDSKGEGTKAITSLFIKYPALKEIVYDDEAQSNFWQKIGGDVQTLKREDFFKYFENKFGFNPDIRYAEGGLIAPNGKPSNLTPEQYKLVRTPEFKAWFGDWENSPETASKVVDENGEPLVVYHGTSSFFNIFKEEEKGSRGRLNEKFWSFTTNIQQALVYALDTSKYGGFSEPKILPVFLDIKDMPTYDNEGKFYRDLKVSAGYKDIDIFQLQDFHSRGFDMGVEFKEVDGFCVKNTIEMEKINSVENENELIGDTYYVRYSNQIKLADGTNNTFDTNNPDIRFAEGGRFDDQELLKKYKAGESIGFTAIAHLKAKGLIARADGTKRKSDKYKEMGGNVDEEIKLPDLNMSYGALKKTLNYQGYDIEPMKQELQIGKVAKGMSVQQIAQHHNTTVDEIQKQLDKGIQVEMEHTDNQYIARAIALDHVYESPIYYDKLETIEKEFKDGGVVVGKRHSEYDENGSGEKFLVESTGQVVELEGGEGVLCQESMSSDKKFSFEGKSMTGREIASYLNHKYGGVEFAKGGEVKKIDKIKADMPHVCGCKHQYYHGGEVPTAVVRNLKGGEAVVTVKSMESKDQYNFNGKPMTPRQIFSQINMASGGKKFEDGGVINIQSIKDDARLEFDIQLAKMMYFVTTLNQMI